MSCPSIWATLSALLINIKYFLGSFQLFLHSDQPSEGEIIPFKRCLPVGSCIIHAGGGGGFTHWLTDCFWCANWRRPKATSSRRASFSALASANSLRVFCIERSNITPTHLHVSTAAFASFSSPAFLSRWLCGNGVIIVMINSLRQADDDADNQSGDNRGDSAHTSISDRSARFLNFAIRLSALCSNWP